MTDTSPMRRPDARPPRRNDRLHTVGAGIIAVLAVLAGVLLVNLVHSPSKQDKAAAASSPAAAAPKGGGQPAAAGPGASPATKATTAHPAPTPTPTPASPAPAPAAPAPPASTAPPSGEPVFEPVIILNNSRIPGQAEAAVPRVKSAGFPVDRVGNFSSTYNVAVPTVFYDAGHEAAARTLMERVPGIKKIVPKSETKIFIPEPLILVVTKDFPTDLTEG